ncbi:MAG: LacI family transcriptional regulator [Lachnospiraceae bacterium]|nr:LacI family transcriptional regulator [Lachnospiraceae bacterium]
MATIKDIANKLGIAVSTVSKGLNGAPDISEDLRQLVLDTAVEMGYKTKRMRKENHKKLAILIENMDYENINDFGYDLILGFRQMAYRDNWQVDVIHVTDSMQEKEKYNTYMLKHGYTGAFCMGFALQDTWMKQISKTGIPTALLDNYVTLNQHVGYVGTDSYEGIGLAVKKLVKMGHKKIAFLNGSRNSWVSDQRQESYETALKDNKLTLDPALTAFGHYVADSAKYHVPGMLEAGATAILCGNDLIASGVYEVCKDKGLRIPEDISVVGFDDIPLASEIEPGLTTIRQDRLELGKCAYFTLNSLVHHVSISKTMLRPQFIERDSIGKVAK